MSGLLRGELVGARRAPEPELVVRAHRRARVAQGMLVAYGATLVGSAAWGAAFPFTSETTFTVGLVVAFVLTAVAFASWKVAAYRLVPALSGLPADRSPGWAAGAYAVPIMNLYVPYQIMREIREASDPADLDVGFGAASPAVPLRTWWALWLVGGVLGRIVDRIPEPGLYDDPTTYDLFVIATLVVWLAATAAAVLVVRGIDEGQREVAAILEAVEAERATDEAAG